MCMCALQVSDTVVIVNWGRERAALEKLLASLVVTGNLMTIMGL